MTATDKLIYISSTIRTKTVPPATIRKLVEFIAAEEKAELGYVEIEIVGRNKMARLNGQFLSHAGVTDVISFELAERPGLLSAQIIVCWDLAKSQARRRGISPSDELLLYITHGLLHTLGYDDQTEKEFQRMHAREQKLLNRLFPRKQPREWGLVNYS